MNKFKAFLQDSISTIVKIFLAIVVAVIIYVFIQQILWGIEWRKGGKVKNFFISLLSPHFFSNQTGKNVDKF